MEFLSNKIAGVLLPMAILAAAPIILPGRLLLLVGAIFGAALGTVAWPLLFGAVSGSVGAAVIRPDRQMVGQAAKIFVGALLGIGLAAPISRYFAIEDWEYLLGISTVCGLTGRIVARAVYTVFERRAEPVLEEQAEKYLGRKKE